MSNKPRRQFTPQQKTEAVQIVLQSGKPISQIAKEMGLTESALRNWVKQTQIDQAAAPNGSLTTEERQELAKLRRDAKRLQMERDFLKKSRRLLCSGELKSYELIKARVAQPFRLG